MINQNTQSATSGRRSGFTLIELLVVIGIIGMLIALLLPAVQAAREAARKVQCRNHLKQLSLAVINHESVYTVYPSNGWGWRWCGDPDRGSGIQQPGGWIYQTLPFAEQGNFRDVGLGASVLLKRLKLSGLMQQSLPIVRCPSRPAADTCPADPLIVWRNAELAAQLARTDYVGNGGDVFPGLFDGPLTIAQGDSKTFAWPNMTQNTGVFFLRSEMRPRDITDGLSQTLMIAEKYVSRKFYYDFGDKGYDHSFLAGDDWDLIRWTEKSPQSDGLEPDPERFGSVHAGGFQAALCDGSVRTISYSVDGLVFRYLGNRRDGQVIAVP